MSGEAIQEADLPFGCEVFNLSYLTIFFSQKRSKYIYHELWGATSSDHEYFSFFITYPNQNCATWFLMQKWGWNIQTEAQCVQEASEGQITKVLVFKFFHHDFQAFLIGAISPYSNALFCLILNLKPISSSYRNASLWDSTPFAYTSQGGDAKGLWQGFPECLDELP